MSRKLATTIKDSAIPGKYKRVLEAYAAFANNDGSNIYAAKKKLGNKAGCSPDTVYRQTPDLLASRILSIAQSHTCKIANCNKGATHFTGKWGHYTIAYNIDISFLQNAETYLSAKHQKVRDAKCRKVGVANCGTTRALRDSGTQTDSHAEVPSVNELTKEPLASLAEVVALHSEASQPLNSLGIGSEEKATANPEPVWALCHPSVWSLQRIWKNRTGRLFTDEEMLAADELVRTYRYRVVESVLRNTLHERPNSSKLRWNKFTIFAKHWERNHDEYLAYCASAHHCKDRGLRAPIGKFDMVPDEDKVDLQEWKVSAAWFKNHGKIGEWDFPRAEWESMGFRRGHVFTAIKYCSEESVPVTKKQFLDLLMECAGLRAVGAVAGFDPEEARDPNTGAGYSQPSATKL